MSAIQNRTIPTLQDNFCIMALLTGSRQDLVYVKVVKYFYCQFQGGASFVNHLFDLCFVLDMLSCLFISALWSPAGKGLTSWLNL